MSNTEESFSPKDNFPSSLDPNKEEHGSSTVSPPGVLDTNEKETADGDEHKRDSSLIEDFEKVDADQIAQIEFGKDEGMTESHGGISSNDADQYGVGPAGPGGNAPGVDLAPSAPLSQTSPSPVRLMDFGGNVDHGKKDGHVESSEPLMASTNLGFPSESPRDPSPTDADSFFDRMSSSLDKGLSPVVENPSSSPRISTPDMKFEDASLTETVPSKGIVLGDSPSPRELSPSPRELTPSPRELTPSPRELTPPREISPPKEPTLPREPTPPLREPTPPPKEPTTPPREPTPPPRQPTPPREPTPPPREPTPPPREPTPPPREPTPPPKEPTPPPKEPTPPPKEPTPPPREPTPPPREPTPQREPVISTSEATQKPSSLKSSFPDVGLPSKPVQEPTVSESVSGLRSKQSASSSVSSSSLGAFHPVMNLIYWRDVKKSGFVFGFGMVVLISLAYFSLISVVAYSSLFVLTGTVCYRIFQNIRQAIQKSMDGHPFKEYLEMDLNLEPSKVQEATNVFVGQMNCIVTELKRLFLVEDIIDSIKFGCLLWCLVYVGSWFNGLTLIILAFVALFSLPKVYEQYQSQIDQYIDLVRTQVNDIMTKVKAAIPIGNKEKDKEKAQ